MLRILTRRSFAAARVRNLIAVLAIALTGILFTSVTTIVAGTMQSISLTLQMQKGSKSDGEFRNMSAEQFAAMRESELIERAGMRMPVGFLENAKRHNVEFAVLDETQAELTFCMPGHGSVPRAADEIVASDRALQDLGVPAEVGAEVDIVFTAHGKTYEMPVRVSGFYEATNDQLSVMWAGEAFKDANPDIFRYTYDKDGEVCGSYFSDFVAVSTNGLEEKIKDLSRAIGGNPDDWKADNFLPAVVNRVTNPEPDVSMIVIGIIFVGMFIFCGYLLIYNVFDIAVMQEIRRYGLYRTIGMGKRHVKTLINRQALYLSLMGIPFGLFIGFFIGKAALPYIMNIVGSEYQRLSVNVTPSPFIFAGAAFLTALTVWISTRKPIKKAVGIPPMEAFRYVESGAGKKRERKSAFGASLSRLAWSNLGRNKRRSVFIVLSLMLCILLLNCAGIAADSVDIEKQTTWMIRTDFAVVNAVSMSNLEGFTGRRDALKEKTIQDIAAQPGVTGGTAVYKNTMEDTNVTYSFPYVETLSEDAHIAEAQSEEELPILYDGEKLVFGIGEDKRPICNVYGMEEEALARMDLREGETDVHMLYQKMENGEGVLVGVPLNRNDMEFYEYYNITDVGETISVYKNGQLLKELPVLAKAGINGDDEEIGFTCKGPGRIGYDGLYLYLPADIYREIYDEPVIYKYSFNVAEENRADMTAYLEEYMKYEDGDIGYLSAQKARESAMAMRNMIRFVGGLVGIIFGFAGVLNLINTIITTILTRRREFATMQSIGMTGRQLMKMMVFESLYYAGGACILGITAAVISAFTLVKGLTEGFWFLTFCFTLLPAAVAAFILLLLAGIVPVAALKAFHNDSIVEQLRIAE